MNKIILSALFIGIFFGISNAQRKIVVSEKNFSFVSGNQNSLVVNIYEADEDLILKQWKKLMKDYDAKVSSKKEVFADNALIKNLSPNTVDVYAVTEKNQDGDFNLVVAIDLGGAYLSSSSHPDKYKTAERVIYDFAVETTKEAIKEQVKEQEKNLEKLQSEAAQLVKDKENLQKSIEDYKAKILQAEEDIKTNEKSQTDKTKEIENQTVIVNEIKEKQASVK
ncbi:MAG TPA: hypothetical protein DDX39_00545 [Bacteroidales bacterium]|nr:MAG: hypothetical protein A2W98_09650 [Bacteroidetes bacterium GWF2_33_38]OFY74770.1 MAG: hypothetical protein A2265_07600 [Bacteroidetes bacterium RIFOXYA12_FULL_33_9]OFY91205.1 MAG: hypothetical protein A2236_08570 [Bacteroidetes bacterium RIFOXYA2_FULL_33_7]HBF87099.1 hypothetical protein [Bacteroidales bacterium]